MPAKNPEISPEMEDKLERMYGAASPDPAFARRLRERIVEQAEKTPVEDRRTGAWLHTAWRLGLGLAGMALLVAFLLFSIGLLPKNSLAPAGGSTPAVLLPTASPTVQASPTVTGVAVPTEKAPSTEPVPVDSSKTISISSPDGRWMAVLDRHTGSLEVTGPQGKVYPLFPAGSTVSAASWSPDSLRLAVVLGNWPEKAPQSQDKGIPEIWMVSFAEGTPGEPAFLYRPEPAALMGAPAGQVSLGTWSPDSRRLLFWTGLLSASIQADGLPMWLLDADSGQASLLSQATLLNPAYQSWAPDGSALAFTDGGYRSAQVGKHLSLYGVSSKQVTTLVPEEKQVPGALDWSPDGAWIAYAAVEASQTGMDWADWMSWDNPALLARRIYLLNLQSGETRRLDKADAYQDAPRWRADGKRLFYVQMDGDQAVLMSANPVDGTAQPLSGCSTPLPATAGYYGQVDWGSLYASCPQALGGAAPGVGSSLSMDSSSEEIRQRILNPIWDTLWLQSQATLVSPTGVQDNFYVQAWLDRSGTGRVLSSDQIPGSLNFNLDMDPRWVWTSDGQKLTLFDVQSGQFDPSTANQRWFVHPLESAGQAMGMLFPSYLAPRSEGLQVVSMEQQAGRPALVVDWAYFRLWVDAETGVLLRQQTRNGEGSVSQDIAIQSIAYDLPLPESVLSTENLENIRFEAPPIGASSSGPATPESPPQASIPSKIIFSAKTSQGVEIFSVGESGGQPLQLTHDSNESPDVMNTHPACSPDGTWIAFTGIRDGQSDIFLMYPDGKGEVRLTDDPADDTDAAFSADGKQIAFVSQRDGHGVIYIMELDGTILGSLADLPGNVSSPAWSPDGSQIAFSLEQDGVSQIYVVNLDGSGLVNLSNYPGSDYDPAWSPDGSKIAFYSSDRGEDGQEAIYVMDTQGRYASILAAGTPRQLQRNMGPAWSPDGKWIAFYSYREGYLSGIFRTPTDGSGQIGMQIALTPNTLEATNPCWLPASLRGFGPAR